MAVYNWFYFTHYIYRMLFCKPYLSILFFVGQPEEVEALVDTLTIEGATLTDTLSNCELQQLAELSQELHLSNEIENQSKSIFIFCFIY